MENPTQPICPVCKSGQNIVRLPDLLFVRTHTISLEDTTDESKQREITSIELINQLMPPPEPKKITGLGMWRVPFAIFGIYLFIGSCGSFFYSLFFLFFVLLSVNASSFSLSSISKDPDAAALIVSMILTISVGVISFLTSIFLTLFYFSSIIHAGKKMKTNSEKTYPIEKQKWESAKKIWSSLYYCTQDNVVFDINNAEQFLDPENTRDYIYTVVDNKDNAAPT